MIKAEKTMSAIDAAIEADQGASFREWLGRVMPHIGDAYRGTSDEFRSHLGASVIGKECPRAIWYGFRWYTKKSHTGRMLRLFNRGHLEEGRFIALLLMLGINVMQQDENGKQFGIYHAYGHMAGSGDGVAIGVPDLPSGVPCLLEFKTSSDKIFKEMVVQGVRQCKPEHYVQMQMYMHKMGLKFALYMMVNKNNDDIHAEIVEYDPVTAAQYFDRGEKIAFNAIPPMKISTSPGFFKCKFCDHRPVCQLNAMPNKNCRTCQFSEVRAETDADGKGVWYCQKNRKCLTKQEQLSGCDDYIALQ